MINDTETFETRRAALKTEDGICRTPSMTVRAKVSLAFVPFNAS
jgi:hypothetical protein